jgi:protein-S-isoprenylcysteine O-methyltransferase Ste14
LNALELKAPPIFVLAAFALLAWGLDRALPALEFRNPYAFQMAAALTVAGALLLFASAFRFFKSKTTVDPRKPEETKALVLGGLYAFSRNPMYVGFACVLLACMIRLSNAAAFPAFPGFILYIHRFQILPEERFLESKFGDAYRAYKRRVRAWI